MRRLETIVPKRASALSSFSKCAGLVVGRTFRAAAHLDESGPAADLGTCVGRGCELWHNGKTWLEIQSQLKEEHEAGFPKADLDDALKTLHCYVQDERNRPEVVVPGSQERKVVCTLDPHESDPTGEKIVITGHIDQLRWAEPWHPRKEELGMKLWDIKNGKPSGEDMVFDYAFQQAAYLKALEQELGVGEVVAGGIIRTKGYRTRNRPAPSEANVFFYAQWRPETVDAILEQVRFLIAGLRSGFFARTPGAHCRYCPLDFPVCMTDKGFNRFAKECQS